MPRYGVWLYKSLCQANGTGSGSYSEELHSLAKGEDSSELKLPSKVLCPEGIALKPLLLFKLWLMPGAPGCIISPVSTKTSVGFNQPVVEDIDFAILFPVVVLS